MLITCKCVTAALLPEVLVTLLLPTLAGMLIVPSLSYMCQER